VVAALSTPSVPVAQPIEPARRLVLGPRLPAVHRISEWEMGGDLRPVFWLDAPPAFAPMIFAELGYGALLLVRDGSARGSSWSLRTLIGDAGEDGVRDGSWQFVASTADGRIWAVLDSFREGPSWELEIISSGDGGRT
jgi:hypothetical protein